ncbi:NYN domain-containing protein [Podospora aff. communis PSN243]|uniref:NYN domain-containing protein n=1 Tax=Podospora aff. communis PSN243 TaxID=3040156 RepID=A0AAV9GV55_9PEZI|nr:NYN domain-containing protein [Podospora aff. communis PSN243]
MATDTSFKLAVLIDADNAQPSVANALLVEVAKFGTAFVRRAYGDWTGPGLKGWKEALLTESIQPIQQFAYTQGKNATDSAMIIDAMDLLYTNRFDGFCLVSSDSDFTRLASRIRESGLVVYGFGERKTPKPFVAACDKFIYFDNLRPIPPIQAPPFEVPSREKRPHPPGAIDSPSKIQKIEGHLNLAEVKHQLRSTVEAASDEDGWANLAKVGMLMTRAHPDFDSRSYGYPKLADLFAATGLFDLDRRTPGEGKGVVVYARDRQGR